jgi:hypothetical protein
MVLSAKQRQKKIEKKTQKRKQVLSKKPLFNGVSLGRSYEKDNPLDYVNYPIYECLVPDGLFEIGLGTIVVSRRAPGSTIALGAFVVDVFCLGVKDAFFSVMDSFKYETHLKQMIKQSHEGQSFKDTHPAEVYKLIEGAVAYAAELGFSAHEDYKEAKKIFGEINSDLSHQQFSYGRYGKPFYISGPKENDQKVREIITQLHAKCGAEGFNYLTALH